MRWIMCYGSFQGSQDVLVPCDASLVNDEALMLNWIQRFPQHIYFEVWLSTEEVSSFENVNVRRKERKSQRRRITIEEFLLERLHELELELGGYSSQALDKPKEFVLGMIDSYRDIIKWHQKWPTLIESQPELEIDPPLNTGVLGLNQFTARFTQKMDWMTQQEYRKKFGDEPPTAPLLKIMAMPWKEHSDYNSDWYVF